MTKTDHAGNAAYSVGFKYTRFLGVIAGASFALFLRQCGAEYVASSAATRCERDSRRRRRPN